DHLPLAVRLDPGLPVRIARHRPNAGDVDHVFVDAVRDLGAAIDAGPAKAISGPTRLVAEQLRFHPAFGWVAPIEMRFISYADHVEVNAQRRALGDAYPPPVDLPSAVRTRSIRP